MRTPKKTKRARDKANAPGSRLTTGIVPGGVALAGISRWRRSSRHRFSNCFSALAATAFVGGGEHVDPPAQYLDYPDLRNKILFTLAMLLIFRIVAYVPVPGIDPQR